MFALGFAFSPVFNTDLQGEELKGICTHLAQGIWWVFELDLHLGSSGTASFSASFLPLFAKGLFTQWLEKRTVGKKKKKKIVFAKPLELAQAQAQEKHLKPL